MRLHFRGLAGPRGRLGRELVRLERSALSSTDASPLSPADEQIAAALYAGAPRTPAGIHDRSGAAVVCDK